MKKNILAVFGLMLVAGLAFGQSFETSDIDVWTGGDPADNLLQAHATVTNTTNEAVPTKVRYNEVSLVQGANHYFCWQVCFQPGDVHDGFISSNTVTLDPGATSTDFYADYLPQGTSGISTMEYCFINADDQSDSTCFRMVFDTENVGIDDSHTLLVLGAYPNPANNELTINYQLANDIRDARIEIFDMLGAKVKSVNLEENAGKQVIDTSVLPSGMYFYKMASSKMDLGLRKFLVTH